MGEILISSMTAYARASASQTWGQASWEIRSVNHRYLDLTFKLPEAFRGWESHWRTLASEYLQRGKVECILSFAPSTHVQAPMDVNIPLVQQLLDNIRKLAVFPEIKIKVNALEVLRWPAVLNAQAMDLVPLQAPLTELFKKALNDCVETRKREGNEIQKFLLSKLEETEKHLETSKKAQPRSMQAQKQKMLQKLNDLQLSVDNQRLEQEFIFHAGRIDVEEEIQRLGMHVNEIKRVLSKESGIGRRLDFLMQEMNREANTLAAKTTDGEISHAAIEMKVIIEQMREQIQNVE